MADKIVISTNAGDVVKADDAFCYSNPVETSSPVTGEAAVTSFAFCGTCLDCQETSATSEKRMDYMYVRVNQADSRVPTPTMKLRLTDPSALIVTTIDWAGQTWVFPADNGKCYEIRPNNYQMRSIESRERFNRKAMNYNYVKGDVQNWAANDFETGTVGKYVGMLPIPHAINRWDMRLPLSGFNMGQSYRVQNKRLNTTDSDANVTKVWKWENTLRADMPGGSPSHRIYPISQYYRCTMRHRGCTYTRVGNKFYVNTNNCTNTYCNTCCTNTTKWPAVLPLPSLSNYRLSSTTRVTTSPIRTARKGTAVAPSGMVYEWEQASNWGGV